jgi:hypothetical protein
MGAIGGVARRALAMWAAAHMLQTADSFALQAPAGARGPSLLRPPQTRRLRPVVPPGATQRWRMQLQAQEPAAARDAELAVVCADGLCAVAENTAAELSPAEYWLPRALFLTVCAAYGTNFALGRFMNEALEPSVVSGLRFSIAALTLSPFLKDLKRVCWRPVCEESVRTKATDNLCPVSQEQLRDSVLMSLFIAAGYIGQSISLQTLEAGKVGFICSLSVIVCPILEIVFDNKKVSAGLVAAILLSVSGVATLELTG